MPSICPQLTHSSCDYSISCLQSGSNDVHQVKSNNILDDLLILYRQYCVMAETLGIGIWIPTLHLTSSGNLSKLLPITKSSFCHL